MSSLPSISHRLFVAAVGHQEAARSREIRYEGRRVPESAAGPHARETALDASRSELTALDERLAAPQLINRG